MVQIHPKIDKLNTSTENTFWWIFRHAGVARQLHQLHQQQQQQQQ